MQHFFKLTPIPVAHPEPAGLSSVTPILLQTMPAPEMAQIWPGTWPTEMWRNPCLAFNTDTSVKLIKIIQSNVGS